MIDPRQQLSDYFSSKGYAPHQVAGILGNLFQESNFNPTALGDNGVSYGLAQWNNERLKGLHDFAAQNGSKPDDILTQAAYIDHELNGPEKATLDALKKSTDVPSATAAFLGFERPQGYDPADPTKAAGWQNRLNAAQQQVPVQTAAATPTTMTDATIDNTPPPPPGFELTAPPNDVPPPPPGFDLVEPPKQAPSDLQAKTPSLIEDIGAAWSQRAKEKPTMVRDAAGIPSTMSALRDLGHKAGYLADIPAAGIKYLADNAPDSVKQGASALGQLAGDSSIGGAVLGAKDALSQAAQAHPLTAENLSALGNIASVLPMAKVIPGSTLAKIAESTGDRAGAALAKVTKKGAAYDPIQGMSEIGKTYEANKKQAAALYQARDQLAAGKPIDTAGLGKDVGALIDDIKSDPFHEARGALPRLQKLQDKLEASTPNAIGKTANGELPIQGGNSAEKFDLADAAELKTVMNEAFNPSRWTQSAKGTVYGNLGAKVGKIIDDASVQYPDFGAANELAHKYWLNNVHNPFQDNAVMAKYFKPDDLREFQALADGRIVALHPETLKRANSTVKNIKSAEDLNAIRLALPEPLAEALSKEVLKAQGSSGRLGAALKLAKDAKSLNVGGALHDVADVIGGVQKTPEQMALIKAAKSPPPRMYTPSELQKMGKNKK